MGQQLQVSGQLTFDDSPPLLRSAGPGCLGRYFVFFLKFSISQIYTYNIVYLFWNILI